MIAETVIEALIAETVQGFNENDECFSKIGCLAVLDFNQE
jgi:hypothetical protein